MLMNKDIPNIQTKRVVQTLFCEFQFFSASGSITFFSKILDGIFTWLQLGMRKKQRGNESKGVNHECAIILDKLRDYKCNTKTQHNNFLIIFEIL